MKMPKPEAAAGIESHPEAIEMKEKVIKIMGQLMDRNNELAHQVLKKSGWNNNLKKDTLDELRHCRFMTKAAMREFANRSGLGSGFADNYFEKRAANQS